MNATTDPEWRINKKKKPVLLQTNNTVQSTVNGKWQYKFQDSDPSIFINLMVDNVRSITLYMYIPVPVYGQSLPKSL